MIGEKEPIMLSRRSAIILALSAATDSVVAQTPQSVASAATPSALAWIRQMAVKHNGWLYISRRCNDAEDLTFLCNEHDWSDVAQVFAYVEKLHANFSKAEVQAMTPNPAPILDYNSLPEVPWVPGNTPIHTAIKKAFKFAPDFKISQRDSSYRRPNQQQIVDLAAAWKPRRKVKKPRMDCEDYTHGFLGFLADNGLGNLSIGFCGYQAYDIFGNHIGGHAVALAVDDKDKCWLVDHYPSSTGVWSQDTVKLGGYMNSFRIELNELEY